MELSKPKSALNNHSLNNYFVRVGIKAYYFDDPYDDFDDDLNQLIPVDGFVLKDLEFDKKKESEEPKIVLKLKQPIDLSTDELHPPEDYHKKNTGTENNERALQYICVPKRWILNKVDIDTYNDVLSNATKSKALQTTLYHLWKHLVFREVKNVILKDENLCGVDFQCVTNDGNFNSESFCGKNWEQEFEDFKRKNQDLVKHNLAYYKNFAYRYSTYFGFTKFQHYNVQDEYKNKEIYFNSESNHVYEIETGKFSKKPKENTVPPHEGSFICGIVKKNKKGQFYYKKWFWASEEFKNLVAFVTENTEIKQRESDNALISRVDCSHYYYFATNYMGLNAEKVSQERRREMIAFRILNLCFIPQENGIEFNFYAELMRFMLGRKEELKYKDKVEKSVKRLLWFYPEEQAK